VRILLWCENHKCGSYLFPTKQSRIPTMDKETIFLNDNDSIPKRRFNEVLNSIICSPRSIIRRGIIGEEGAMLLERR